jgi:hypothetical protein
VSRRFVLCHDRAIGDIVVLTALVRDLKLTYPEFQLDVDTSAPDLWRNNPHLTPLKGRVPHRQLQWIKCAYGEGIRQQRNETVHFVAYFHRDFEKQTKLHVPLNFPHGDLHLSAGERDVSLISGRYWVVLSGGKSDFTAKVWKTTALQAVVDRLVSQLGLGVVQIGSNDSGHWHPPLRNVLDLRGESNLRDMLRLIQHADGVLCGVTSAMHMAAALQRPCVVWAGGREAWWWEAYVNENTGFGAKASGKLGVPHRFLHTIGLLDCCSRHGCWKSKVTRISNDNSLCKHPVETPGQPVPLCMEMITPDHVFNALKSYYDDGTLSPLSTATQTELTDAGEASTYARQPPKQGRRLFLLDV